MMRNFLLTSAILMALPTSAHAATFDFSYIFNTGETITGRISGTSTGDLVSVDSVENMRLNGVAFNGPLVAFGSTRTRGDNTECGAPCLTQTAIMSMDALKNNFIIGDITQPGFHVTNYFYIIPWASAPTDLGLQAVHNGNVYNAYNGQYIPANWSLKAVSSSAPEPAAWAMMLAGLGLVGSAMRRREKLNVNFA